MKNICADGYVRDMWQDVTRNNDDIYNKDNSSPPIIKLVTYVIALFTQLGN